MRGIHVARALFMTCAIVAISSACASRHVASNADATTGAALYQTSCAGCHGTDATGNGPITPVIGVRPPDLTRIAARRGGTFPELEVFRIIDGQADLSAHGPRHMPVWGYEFYGTDADDEIAHRQAEQKVDALVSYLRTIQRAP